MNILAIYPGLNPKVNDVAHVLFYLIDTGHTVRVITAKNNKSKSSFDSADHETINGLEIYRPYTRFFPEMILWPRNKIHLIKRLLHGFSPDVILCSQEFTIRLGLEIKRFYAGKPKIVVVSEFAGDLAEAGHNGIQANLILPLVGLPPGQKFWPWLMRQTDAVITCYPPDGDRLEKLSNFGKPVHFAPWCNHLPGDLKLVPKKHALAIYIGFFSKGKNTDEFSELVPEILNKTPTEKILFVGNGKTQVLEYLQKKFGKAIEHIRGLPRREALEALSSAFYGITPVKKGGWGFYGDCWAVRTPVVSVYNDYGLNHRVDAVVGHSVEGVIQGINQLYENSVLYQTLQDKGYQRYTRFHTAQTVGQMYEQVLSNILM